MNSKLSLEAAKMAAQMEYRERDFDPRALMKKLGVEVERGVYERSPH